MAIRKFYFVTFCCVLFSVVDVRVLNEVIFERIESICEDPNIFTFTSNVTKVNKTSYAFNVDVNLVIDIKRETQLITTLQFYAAFSNRYQKVPITIRKNLCDQFDNELRFVKPLIKKYSNLDPKCPVKAGHYWLRNFMIDDAMWPSVLPWEKMMMEFSTEKDGKCVQKHRLYFKLNIDKRYMN